jgi:hypothetical protein
MPGLYTSLSAQVDLCSSSSSSSGGGGSSSNGGPAGKNQSAAETLFQLADESVVRQDQLTRIPAGTYTLPGEAAGCKEQSNAMFVVQQVPCRNSTCRNFI